MAEYKDISDLKKQISDFKKAVYSPNGDYLTGYVCALSATEGIIAGLPDADVVEVVRCKECKQWEKGNPKTFFPDCGTCWKCMLKTHQDHFCYYGERKNNETL